MSDIVAVKPPAALTERATLVKHVSKYSAGSLVAAAGNLVNYYLAAVLLGPPVWGVWQGSQLILRYGQLLHFGAIDGMHRELPAMRGRGRSEDALRIARTVLAFAGSIALVLGFGIFLASFVLPRSPEWKLAVRFISGLVVLQYFSQYYNVLLQAHHKFEVASRVQLLNGIGAIASVALLLAFGFAGFLAGQFCVLAATTTYAAANAPLRSWPRVSKPAFVLVLGIGFPIFLSALSGMALLTVDRLMILHFFTEKDLGYYGLASLVFAPIQLVFSATNQVVYPRLTERLGRTGDPGSLGELLRAPVTLLATAMAFLVAALAISLPVIAAIGLPAYLPGVPTAQIALFGLLFVSLGAMANNILVTFDRQIWNLGLTLACIPIAVAVSVLLIYRGVGLPGVACGITLAYSAYAAAALYLAVRLTGASKRHASAFVARTFAPVLASGAIVLLCVASPWRDYPLRTALLGILLLGSVMALPLWRQARVLVAATRHERPPENVL